MSEKTKDETSDKSTAYQDFITYEPDPIKFISKEKMDLISKHSQIIRALRNKNMTVKEIHELYFDADTGKHTFTIKTIYKHLDRLEEANLVKVSGHRMTEGSRQTEKLYSRTGNLFYPDPNEERPEGDVEGRKEYAESLNIILSELLEVPKADKDSFYDFYMLLREHKYQSTIEILEKVKTSKSTAEVFIRTDLEKVNKMNETISLLMVFLRHPEVLERLRDLYT
ncbi:MAG: hypothetical protein ACFFD4_16060 [Candidatus Odinarchaeota archaeon]